MNKGQAFDTFKLMIAAVIAVAILGILLGILQGVQPPTGDPTTTMRDLLSKSRSNPGNHLTSQQEVTFSKGTIFTGAAFQQSVFGGQTPDITFECDKEFSALCKAGKTLEIVNDFKSQIKTCCAPTDTKTCVIHVGTGSITPGLCV